jgi:acyl carrier protein
MTGCSALGSNDEGRSLCDVDVDARVVALVLEYSQSPPSGPLDPKASLRKDLGVDSLSLVSVAVALGDQFGVDLVEWGADLSKLEALADLIALGHALARASTSISNKE